MSSASDFIIENGVLKKYVGPGGDVVIPEGVTSIEGYFEVHPFYFGAFKGRALLTSVTIPEGVTNIGREAFCNCRKLSSVTIPDSLTSIGDSAFKGCAGLADQNGFVIIRGILHDYCGSKKDVAIPKGVTRIGSEAFEKCRNLTSVTIPDSVTSIGEWAFSGCSSLTSVTIPESVAVIGKNAFDGCKNITSIFTNTRLSKDMFGKSLTNPIVTNDPGMLPAHMKPLAAIGFAEQPDDPKSERGKKHLKYIKSSAAKLVKESLSHPALLRLMCENKLLTPEVTEAYLAAAQEAGNAESTSLLLDYQQNKLTAKEKEKAVQQAETREEKVTDFIFSAEALEQLQGKVFVVTGALKSFTRAEFKACLDACGAILSETMNEQTDYLITNTPNSGSAKNKKADALGVKKLSEAEFNRLIGRS